MADPILEQIALEIFKRLETITPNHATIPFNYAPSRIIRPSNSEDWGPEHLKIILKQGDWSPDYESSPEANGFRLDSVQEFNFYLIVKATDDEPEPNDAIVNRFRSDVERAVTAPANWHNFGDLAINSEWAPATMIESDGSYDGIVLTLLVTYRTPETNPFTQG